MKLIECVPNISEGRDPAIIQAVTDEVEAVDGAMLLDVDPGQTTHRTVITFVGPPDAVAEAAFRVIRKAAEVIDMSRHEGEHARMGATDVCPFVPMGSATMDDCVALAQQVGERVGRELKIPIYLYGAAAQKPERRRLPDIRQGEYEALPEKLKDPAFAPDFGPATFNPRAGATAIGGREFLIAWNINVNTRQRKLANKIAAELREIGKLKRDARNKFVRDADGRVERVPGRFKELQGGGWVIEEYDRAQLSFNIMDNNVAPIHDVFDAACEEASKLGVRVTGSELVGLVPLDALLGAGDHYLEKQGQSTGIPVMKRVQTAIQSLGLAELGPFDPLEKIIEFKYFGGPKGLRGMTLTEFADELSSDSVAPGGGSVAALCGALSAALTAMVGALTWNKRGMESVRPKMQASGTSAQALKDWFLVAVDADTEAFNDVIAAGRLPKNRPEEIAARDRAIELANQQATRVPLDVLSKCVEALDHAAVVAEHGNPNSVSDAGVAAACALAAAEGAALNVRINLPSLTDISVRDAIDGERTTLMRQAKEKAASVASIVDRVLSRQG